jgi:hypothetical protein
LRSLYGSNFDSAFLAWCPRRRAYHEEDAHAIGVQAYLYFYSLVTMDLTRKQLTNFERPEGFHAPMNAFASLGEYPMAEMKWS